MYKNILFIKKLILKINENEILPLATQLTYKLIFSIFPFIIFLISLIGFFNIETQFLIDEIYIALPYEIAKVIDNVISETVVRRPNLLSLSLVFSIYTISGSFRSAQHGISKVYEQKNKRHFFLQAAYSILLTLIMSFTILVSMIFLIYGEVLHNFISAHLISHTFIDLAFGFLGYAIAICLMLFSIILIYKVSLNTKKSFKNLLPGTIFTLLIWVLASVLFSIYVSNFSRYPLIYGSIASVFITMLWLNIISITLLIGAQINAMLR